MSVFPGKFQIFVKLGGGGCLHPPPPGPCAFGLDSVACTMLGLFLLGVLFRARWAIQRTMVLTNLNITLRETT